MRSLAKKKIVLFAATVLAWCVTGCAIRDRKIDRRFVPQVQSAAFYGANHAWLVTFNGDLLITQDGGNSWNTVVDQPGKFDEISFIDDRNGWADTNDNRVLRTTDGGTSWYSIANLGDRGYGPRLGKIKFIDEVHGWIIHPLFLWHTDDGGITWRQDPSPQQPGKALFHCAFANPFVGWLAGSGGAFYRTQDGGKTWQEQIGK